MKAFTVTQLNEYIARKLNSDYSLKNVPIEGEISGISRRGHVYLTLKDENSVIRAVVWQSNLRSIDPKLLEDGRKVIALGSISPYAKGGSYSFSITNMEDAGIGKAKTDFEALKKKLLEEGLFDQKYKKPIPAFPKRVAVITSTEGDALRDIKKIILSKNNYTDIYVINATVQGPMAPASLIEGLKIANMVNKTVKPIDTIIIGRGGGSSEDLQAFNDEGLARAIFASEIPVISAVGHETNVSISDFVADRRAETPTAAADMAVPDTEELRSSIEVSSLLLRDTLRNKIKSERSMLDLNIRLLYNVMKNRISRDRMVLERSLIAIQEGNPEKIFDKGYAAVLNDRDEIVPSIEGINEGSTYTIKMKDGYFTSTVKEVKR